MQTLLMLGCLFVAGQDAKPQSRLDIVRQAQERDSKVYHDALDAAKTDEERQRAIASFHVRVVENSDAALRIARDHPTDPDALDALTFVIQTARAGPSDRSERAIAMMTRDHVRDARMGKICAYLFMFVHLESAETLIRSVVNENPDPSARGFACHALAGYLTNQARTVRRLNDEPALRKDYEQSRGKARIDAMLRDKRPDALEIEAATILERVISEFGALTYDKQALAEVASGELFAIRHLKIGQPAPEIEGQDVEGHRFTLNEYRGKVVVLSFSGNWCGPCRAMYPSERALVERMKGKPFVLLSVNTDDNKETLRKSIASGEITWKCWFDGGTEGPITTRWGVSAFPAVSIIDAEGVIRHKNVRDSQLDGLVDALMEFRK